MRVLLLSIWALAEALAGDKPKEPIPIPVAIEVKYWAKRALMMDWRLDLANLQAFGGTGAQWTREENERVRTQREFDAALSDVQSACGKPGLDIRAIDQEKVLRCNSEK